MARLHSSLGDRTVYTAAGLAKAQGYAATVYEDPAGTILANLAAYDPTNAAVPGAAIPGAALVVDPWSNRPAVWDLNDRDVLYISVAGPTGIPGPLEPIRPDAQPQVAALATRVGTVEGVAAAAETPAGATTKANAAQVAATTYTDTRLTAAAVGHDTALRKWYAALANRHAGIASVVVLGDSISEGTGATSVRRRWQQVLQSELRSRFQPAGVTGAVVPYMTASPRLTPVPSDYGVTVVGAVTQASFGLGLKAATVAAGQSVTFTFTGTRAKFYASKGPSVGRYGIVLDGAAEVMVDGFSSGALLFGQMVWDSGALTAGTHTVVVSRAASTTASPGNIFPEGLAVFNGDEASGVRVVDAARHGATLATFTASDAWYTALGAVQGAGLLIMPWGANDSTSGTTAAAFRAGLDAIIANARTAGFAGSILLVEMPKRGNATEQVWTDYRAQIEAVAAADADITTLDLRARMPDYGTTEATALALYADEVHYTDKGQGWIADQIATAITPR